MSLSKSKSNPN